MFNSCPENRWKYKKHKHIKIITLILITYIVMQGNHQWKVKVYLRDLRYIHKIQAGSKETAKFSESSYWSCDAKTIMYPERDERPYTCPGKRSRLTSTGVLLKLTRPSIDNISSLILAEITLEGYVVQSYIHTALFSCLGMRVWWICYWIRDSLLIYKTR